MKMFFLSAFLILSIARAESGVVSEAISVSGTVVSGTTDVVLDLGPSKEKIAAFSELYKKNQTAGKATLIPEVMYKELKLDIPECKAETLEEKFKACQNYNCVQSFKIDDVNQKKEMIISNVGLIHKICRLQTPEKNYKVYATRREAFGKLFKNFLESKTEDDAKILDDVVKTGRSEQNLSFNSNSVNCEFIVTYEFAVDKTNVISTLEYLAAHNGIYTKSTAETYYTEDGISYKKIDSKKPVFYYAKVKMVEPTGETAQRNCTDVPELIPLFLDQLNQIEHLPPDETL